MCSSLNEIIFKGTMEQWNAAQKTDYWNYNTPAKVVKCSNGEVSL